MNHSALPTYCRSGCGFYGSPATEGLCSKCFKESLKRTNKTADPGISPTSAGKADEAALIVASNNPIASVVAATSAPGDAVVNGRAQEMQTSAPTSGGQPQGCIEFASSSVGADDQQVGVLANQVCASSISADSSGSSSSTSLAADGDAASLSPADTTSAPTTKKSNRCDTCRKKTGLTGFPCRCGGLFCSTHRYSDMHGCKFDYKSLGQEEIRKNNPVVEAKKIEKL